MKTAMVDAGLTPVADCLCRVISTVFIVVQKPNVSNGVVGCQEGVRDEREAGEGRTHGRVRLSDTSSHTTEQTSSSGRDTHADDGVLDLTRREEKDGTLGRRFDPGLLGRGRWSLSARG